MAKHGIQTFYKLLFGSFRFVPERLPIFYGSVPLHFTARFDGDRFVFSLPLNLAEKMHAGGLFADLCYSDIETGTGDTYKSPTSIILRERYS